MKLASSALSVLLYGACAAGVHAEPLAARSGSPFTQIFGLPMPPAGAANDVGEWQTRFVYQVVNHADAAAADGEAVVIDGETHVSNFMVSVGLGERWQGGIDVPYLAHRPGSLDGFIEDWHSLWGISNGNRSGPRDQLAIDYARGGSSVLSITDSTSGVGDVRLWAEYAIRSGGAGGTRWAARATAKLPTGDEDDLHGSGATDVALDLAFARRVHEGRTALDLTGHFGLLFLGDGDVLPALQEDLVPYGGASLTWSLTERFAVLAQVSAQGSYFDSELDEIGGTTAQITAGLRYRWIESKVDLAVGLVEDLVSDVTPDVAFHVELRKGFE